MRLSFNATEANAVNLVNTAIGAHLSPATRAKLGKGGGYKLCLANPGVEVMINGATAIYDDSTKMFTIDFDTEFANGLLAPSLNLISRVAPLVKGLLPALKAVAAMCTGIKEAYSDFEKCPIVGSPVARTTCNPNHEYGDVYAPYADCEDKMVLAITPAVWDVNGDLAIDYEWIRIQLSSVGSVWTVADDNVVIYI